MARKEFNLPEKTLVPFSGKLTVDGSAPTVETGQSLWVVLYDPKNPPPEGGLPKVMAACKEDGSFQFPGGVEPGAYTLLFVKLRRGIHHFRGKEGLNNLYNDPEKNKDQPELNVEIAPPGKTDYAVNLEVVGKDPVKTPGKHAVVSYGK